MTSISKNEYKVTLLLLKYFPIVVLIGTMISAILVHYGVATSMYIFLSPSIISLVMMVILSKLFKFCYVHRIPIYWMIIGKFLLMFTGENIIDLVPQVYNMLIYGGIGCIVYTVLHFIFGNKIREKLGLTKDENCYD